MGRTRQTARKSTGGKRPMSLYEMERCHLLSQRAELQRELVCLTGQQLANDWPDWLVHRIGEQLISEYWVSGGVYSADYSHRSWIAARALFALYHTHEYFGCELEEIVGEGEDGGVTSPVDDVFMRAGGVHAWQQAQARLAEARAAVVKARDRDMSARHLPASICMTMQADCLVMAESIDAMDPE
jgi:hypothetical protein